MNTYEHVKSEYIKWSGKEYQHDNLESQENIILFALHYHRSQIQNIENEIVVLNAHKVEHVALLGAAFREMIDTGNKCDNCHKPIKSDGQGTIELLCECGI
jgi:hypothetical protein